MYHKLFIKYKLPFFFAMACVAIEALCDLLGPTIMARVIDEGVVPGSMQRILFWGTWMLIIMAAGALFAVARSILSTKVSQSVGADLRRSLFEKSMRLSESGSDRIESGSLITRMTNDTMQVVQFVHGMMRIFLKAPLTCIGSIILATALNVRLSLVIYGVVAAVSIILSVSMKLSYPRFSKLQKSIDRVNAVMQEYLLGVRLVKAFGTFREEGARFGQANSQLMRRSVSSQFIITLLSPLLTLSVGAGTILVIFLGSDMFVSGQIQPGHISAFTIYLTQILSSLLIITNVFNAFVRMKASAGRIEEVLSAEEDFTGEAPVSSPETELSGGHDIEFRNVSFTYPGSNGIPVIQNLSFKLPENGSLAIIGSTGSGKSTICWLLLRFYDVAGGAILIGGQDIRVLPVSYVREMVSIAPQRPMLFSGSITDNIGWGRRGATACDIEKAAEYAEASDFIRAMPQSFDSVLGSGGQGLSGGQRQRISIARSLLKNAPILLIDDATSALDALTESRVRERLLDKANNRTVVFVTQRCTTAMRADNILVVEDGAAVGYGTHLRLMECCGTYRDLYRSQVDGGTE